MITKKRIILGLGGMVLVLAAWTGISYYLSLRTLVVDYENMNSVLIFSSNKIDNTQGEKPLKKVSFSGQEIRLKKGSYILQYDAKDNYQDYFVAITLSDKRQSVSLSPDYSDQYLNELLGSELGGIKASLAEKYPKIDKLYDPQKGRLYKKGEWYGTVLTYKGDSSGSNLFKTDALRVVLKKENGKWSVKTDPPYIILNKYAYPDIPIDILRGVNSLQTSPGG